MDINIEAIKAEMFAEIKKDFAKFANNVDEVSSRELAMQITNAMKMAADVLNELAYSDEFEDELTRVMGGMKVEIDVICAAFAAAKDIADFQNIRRAQMLESFENFESFKSGTYTQFDVIRKMVHKAWMKNTVQQVWSKMKSWFKFRFE